MHRDLRGLSVKGGRSGRLKAMGVIQIILGGLTAIIALISLLSMALIRALSPGGQAQTIGIGTILSSFIFYALIAAFFIWVGIGSLRLKRWVRPVVLSVMWPGLVIGIIAFVGTVYFVPEIMAVGMQTSGQPVAPPEGLVAFISVFMIALSFVIYVVIPGVHVLAYQGVSVRETCEEADTKQSWADRCPVPVLGVSMSLVVMGLMILPAAFMRVSLLFGAILGGYPALALNLVLVVISFALARITFRQSLFGWWGTLVFILFLFINAGISFLITDYTEIYRRTGLVPADQIALMGDLVTHMTNMTVAAAFLSAVVAGAYLVAVKKHFR